jgi:endonuclease III
MTTKLDVDKKRAKKVVRRLDTAFSEQEGLLSNQDDLIEKQIPNSVEPLSKEHALFLFYMVILDRGTKSSELYKRSKEIFSSEPERFSPEYIINNYQDGDDPRLKEEVIEDFGARYPTDSAKSWYVNSEMLVDEYNGDPTNLYNSSSDAKQLIEKIKQFRGFGPKIGGMLLRAIIGLGFNTNVENVEEVLVPVDIHDSRISFYTKILYKENEDIMDVDYESHVDTVQEVILEACNNENIEWLDVDRALWLVGSRGCVQKNCHQCPLSDICIVGKEVTENNQRQTTLFEDQF